MKCIESQKKCETVFSTFGSSIRMVRIFVNEYSSMTNVHCNQGREHKSWNLDDDIRIFDWNSCVQ